MSLRVSGLFLDSPRAQSVEKMVAARVIFTLVAVASSLATDALSSGQCRKKINYDGYQVLDIKIYGSSKLTILKLSSSIK